MKQYSLKSVENLIQQYVDKGGDVITISEGVLGYGTTMLVCQGYKTAIIKEQFLNEWSSTHTIRMHNVMPKKYQIYLNN